MRHITPTRAFPSIGPGARLIAMGVILFGLARAERVHGSIQETNRALLPRPSAGLVPALPAGPQRWSAQWIVPPDALSGQNLMFLARRSFTLGQIPGQAVLFITADTRYELYVNGTFVVRGPARSAAHHQSYDPVDVRRHLRVGHNVLAIRVHHAGLAKPYHYFTRPGLLAQLETADGDTTGMLVTDHQWKATVDPSWDSGSPRVNRWHDAYVDIVDLRKRLRGWMTADYDDSDWPAAAAIVPDGIAAAKDRPQSTGLQRPLTAQWWPPPPDNYVPQATTPPWVALVSRDVPFLSESIIKATRLAFAGNSVDPRVGQVDGGAAGCRFAVLPLLKLPPINASQGDRSGIEGWEDYVHGRSAILVHSPIGKSTYLIFDLGEVENGYPRLDIEGPDGAVVDVMCAPYVLNNVFDPTILQSTMVDRLVLSGQREQWEACFFKPARYLAVVLRGATSPVRIHFAGMNHIAYPWKQRGGFVAQENAWIQKFWQAGAKTNEVITTDAYTDNYRERRQYSQTSYYAAKGNYAVFGDSFLQRRYLIQNAEEQEPDGTLGAYAPVTDGGTMPFLDAQFFWLMSWHDYLLYTGDKATALRLLPSARQAMNRLAEMARPGGLIANPPYPYWIDHSNLDRRGTHFTVNALYVLTLDDFAATLDWLDQPDGAQYRQAAAAIREVLRTSYWNPDRGLFTETIEQGKQSARVSEHANAIAVAARIASSEQTRAILPKILKPDPDMVPATPLFTYWTFRALCEGGRPDDALTMLETRFQHQLHSGNGTLWEDWHLDQTNRRGIPDKLTRADAQGECAVFPMALTRWIGGLQPASPGMKEIIIRRVTCSLKDIQVVLPSPRGDVRLAWSVHGSDDELEIEVPAGVVAKLDLASVGVSTGRNLTIDGRTVTQAEVGTDWYVIPAGAHHLIFTAQ